ncbi:MAG TPA: YhfC family glutamic-type intramembrane protease [Anaerolineales bacterium]|nr:YhfC family glutamic-type intramembrane protease [Anaerolineales bacterium]
MIALPIGLAVYMARRFRLGWRLVWIGAATFILSQVLHIPFNNLALTPLLGNLGLENNPTLRLVLIALAYGLSAGLFEELFRYGAYRWWAREARSWPQGVMLGVGHGGVEAFVLGLLVLYGYVQMIALRGMDLNLVASGEQLATLQQQIAAYWSAPPLMSLLGAVERALTIPIQITFSVIVLQVFRRRQIRWLGLAIGWHMLIDAAAVIAISTTSPLATEAVIAGFTALSLVILFALRETPAQPAIAEETPLPPVMQPEDYPTPSAASDLDSTRFTQN